MGQISFDQNEENQLSYLDLVNTVWRRKKIILACSVIGICISLMYCIFVKERFEAFVFLRPAELPVLDCKEAGLSLHGKNVEIESKSGLQQMIQSGLLNDPIAEHLDIERSKTDFQFSVDSVSGYLKVRYECDSIKEGKDVLTALKVVLTEKYMPVLQEYVSAAKRRLESRVRMARVSAELKEKFEKEIERLQERIDAMAAWNKMSDNKADEVAPLPKPQKQILTFYEANQLTNQLELIKLEKENLLLGQLSLETDLLKFDLAYSTAKLEKLAAVKSPILIKPASIVAKSMKLNRVRLVILGAISGFFISLFGVLSFEYLNAVLVSDNRSPSQG